MVGIIRDDDEERLARIDQMLMDLNRRHDAFVKLSQKIRLEATAARLALENARRRALKNTERVKIEHASRQARKRNKR